MAPVFPATMSLGHTQETSDMKQVRELRTAEFKAAVALEAVKGEKTLDQLAEQFSVHPNQVSQWKVRLLERVRELFEDQRRVRSDHSHVNELYEQIGRLKMEVERLRQRGLRVR
jgi:transposase-like protein